MNILQPEQIEGMKRAEVIAFIKQNDIPVKHNGVGAAVVKANLISYFEQLQNSDSGDAQTQTGDSQPPIDDSQPPIDDSQPPIDDSQPSDDSDEQQPPAQSLAQTTDDDISEGNPDDIVTIVMEHMKNQVVSIERKQIIFNAQGVCSCDRKSANLIQIIYKAK